jgi:hypothetical protein
MKLGALTLDAYMLIIVISFWCISPFISIACPSLSHLINVSLMPALSEKEEKKSERRRTAGRDGGRSKSKPDSKTFKRR